MDRGWEPDSGRMLAESQFMHLVSHPLFHPRYRPLKRIGQGGMGEVFRTQDRLTGELVALKRVHLPLPDVLPQTPASSSRETSSSAPERACTLSGTPDASKQDVVSTNQALRWHLVEEFRTLASLQHPHIIRVLDHGLDRYQQPFFTMELLEEAIPIDQAVQAQPMPSRVALLVQILQAITYLHCRGVLHRDLKPANILGLPGPRGLQIKLLDFGLSLFAREGVCPRAKLAGSPGYIAPELLLGAPASAAADLFSVGVVAHEVLLGTHPLAVRPMFERIRGFIGTAPIFLKDDLLGPALSAVLRRALSRDPGQRYVNAAAFGRALAQAVGLPLPAETV